jgi:hypothetical protein
MTVQHADTDYSLLQHLTLQRGTVISVLPYQSSTFAVYCMMEKPTYLLYFYITFTLFIYFILLMLLAIL